MSSVWRKTLVYLGLFEEPDPHDEPAANGRRAAPAEPPEPAAVASGNVRPLRTAFPDAGGHAAAAPMLEPDPPLAAEVVVVGVREFDDSERIGRMYRDGHPVLFDLSEVGRPLARRVLDFVAGMTYALEGRLTPAGTLAFLLVPAGVEVPRAERRRLASLGYGSDA